MALSFHGWIIRDSEGNLLTVRQDLSDRPCDACGSLARYSITVPDGGVSPSCQACLDNGFRDPRSPDTFYAPQHP